MDSLNKIKICKKCHGLMRLHEKERFICDLCGAEELSDFGKVKQYVNDKGASTAVAISNETGVKISVVEEFLEEGRLEIPATSDVFIHCQRCGKEIRYGRFCDECTRIMVNDINREFNKSEMERRSIENQGRMYYLGGKGRKDK